MPHRYGSLPAALIVQICNRVRAGEKREELAKELEVSDHVVSKYTAHLPSHRQNKTRENVLRRFDEGEDVSTIAHAESVPVSFVVRVLRARRFEEEARVRAVEDEQRELAERAKREAERAKIREKKAAARVAS